MTACALGDVGYNVSFSALFPALSNPQVYFFPFNYFLLYFIFNVVTLVINSLLGGD